jgi:hypothetical protein
MAVVVDERLKLLGHREWHTRSFGQHDSLPLMLKEVDLLDDMRIRNTLHVIM